MTDFKIGDWFYAHDWCYGQITDIDDEVACVEFETAGGGGSYTFELSDLSKAPEPKTTIDIRDNLLVTAGVRAGYMHMMEEIDIPSGVKGEDRLASFIVDAVRTYLKLADDIPFDLFIENTLINEFGKEK